MKTVSMSGSLRENVGKKDAKKHRKEGNIPCVIYGGEEQIHFIISERSFSKIIFTPEVYILDIKIGDKNYSAILQDIQYHPVSDKILHADFLELLPGNPVTIGMPIKFEGVAPGVLLGGRLVKKLRKLIVKGLVGDLPDNIVLNIDKLDIGDSIKVKDISYANLEFLDSARSEIIGVKTARGIEEDEEEEEEGEEGEEGATEEGAAEGGEDKKEGREN